MTTSGTEPRRCSLALEIATGKVTDACYPRHRSDEFLKFLKKMRRLRHASPAAHIGACMRSMAVARR